ncbi:HMG box-containing protein 1-like isoform X2 [Takifugu rubripes]|uniref:HMG box-containing protein 1-like isoform X2 n=1 Tax=Takifugu rubripes TaxID=31033 RepID=UPI00114608FE|nr:HMG box-containing protein 1-like isoform X2 [Takifugu rubripes]
MVREVMTSAELSSDLQHHKVQNSEPRQEHADVTMEAESHDLLLCSERLPSSPGGPSSDSYIEYDDLPDLQEVQEEAEPTAPPVYQVDMDVSHQEPNTHTLTQPPDTHRLTQLAHIATGPQSPLLQEGPVSSSSSAWSSNLHSYARAVPRSVSPPGGRCSQRSRSSECGSAVSTRSSLSDDEDIGWNISWPPTAWHCFLKGTLVRFHDGSHSKWRDVDGLGSAEEDCAEEEQLLKTYGSEGLQLVDHTEVVLSGQTVLQLTFDPGAFGQTCVTARCQLDHPFYVKNKGWSSFYPGLTVVHHGIPCYDLEVGALCLPPGHRDAKHADNSLVFDTFRSFDFTPLDSSAVYVLSSMARRRQASRTSGDGGASPEPQSQSGSPPSRQKPNRKQNNGPAKGDNASSKCKRPMNAFMLFAKKFRVEYTQMHPGKDNRAISVLLGEKWKKMRSEERRVFTVQAKALADEQKRLNPDCWKRKRTSSGCQGN